MISIIVAVYNGEDTLQRCINSVTAQTYPDVELVIIDGASTDGTTDILKRNNDKIAYWISEPDTGISSAWNKGIRHSKGDWILFLGADDFLWEDDILEKIAPRLVSNYRIVYGRIARMTKDKISCLDGFSWEHTRKSIIDDGICTFVHQGIFHSRTIFSLYGGFDESLKITGDYELLIRAFKDSGEALFLEDLTIVGMETGGVTSDTIKLVKEVAIARKKNHLKVLTIPWLISYAWALSFPIFTFTIGEKNTRHLLTVGKKLVMTVFKKRD